jgi:protein TonB
MRQIALGVALAVVLGIGIYAKVWTLFPMLKSGAAGVVQQAKNAVGNRGGEKENAPVTGGSEGGTTRATVAPAKSAPTNDAPAGQTSATVASNQAETAPGAAEDTSTTAADSAPIAGVAEPALERRGPEPSGGRKTASGREKATVRNRPSQTIVKVEPNTVQTIAPDEPVIAPKLVHAVAPVYPPEAMLNYITGDVRAELVVEADGKVGEVKVLSGPKALRDAAMQALRKYEYTPGTQGGRPVAARTAATVKFWFNP